VSSDVTEHTETSDLPAEVRAFYERHPYPAPVTNLDGYRDRWDQGDRRRVAYHLLWPSEKYRDDLEVLIAGCGTSQAAKHALREPSNRVIGIDVSEPSLQHSRKLQEKYEIDNLELRQLNLGEVESLGRKFDKIVCTGVLHHLPDPDAGLRALRAVLKPGGAMQLMVYGAYGRTGVYMLQEYCRLLGVRAQDQDLGELGATLGKLPPGHPLAYLLHQAKDFRSPPAMADALLHPQDRAYTVPQLYEWLEHCGCSFGRWSLQAPYLAGCGVVADTPHAARLAALPAPQQHAALELFRGTMVTHEFSACRDDACVAVQPISFDDDSMLDYVPLRKPEAITVKERLPAGAAAVLINPMHRHTDIFLPIDSSEERMLDAIDGSRSVREILRVAANVAERDGRQDSALDFIERLWRHDQIVLDASGS
jgi:SAM-dependent methyltransferase